MKKTASMVLILALGPYAQALVSANNTQVTPPAGSTTLNTALPEATTFTTPAPARLPGAIPLPGEPTPIPSITPFRGTAPLPLPSVPASESQTTVTSPTSSAVPNPINNGSASIDNGPLPDPNESLSAPSGNNGFLVVPFKQPQIKK